MLDSEVEVPERRTTSGSLSETSKPAPGQDARSAGQRLRS
jgi:hypothetical protein